MKKIFTVVGTWKHDDTEYEGTEILAAFEDNETAKTTAAQIRQTLVPQSYDSVKVRSLFVAEKPQSEFETHIKYQDQLPILFESAGSKKGCCSPCVPEAQIGRIQVISADRPDDT